MTVQSYTVQVDPVLLDKEMALRLAMIQDEHGYVADALQSEWFRVVEQIMESFDELI